MSEAARAALEAYRRFFTAFNAQDSTGWTAARHLPHVRVSPRTPTVVIEYEGAHGTSTWDDLRATGWNHSIALEPILLHESASKVHIVGGWTRHRADGSPLLRNHATYIATRSNGTGGGQWAIQGQFGIDAGPPGLTDAHAHEATELVAEYLSRWDDRDFAGCAELANYPLVGVEVGDVRHWADAAAFAQALEQSHWHLITTRTLRVVQAGPAAVNVALDVVLDGGDRRELAVFMCTWQGEHWGVQARSIIDV